MKKSNVKWIGSIPDDWNVVLLSSLFYEHKQKNIGMQCDNLLSLSYGKIKRKDISTSDGLLPESFEGYNIIEPNDIVLRLTDLQNDQRSLRTGLCLERGIVTSAYVTLRSKTPDLNCHFMHYYLYSFDVRKGFYGMGSGVRQGLNFEGIRKLEVLVPPQDIQQKIVDFLDSKCAHIETLIAKQQEQIDKLKEYRTTVIAEYVVKGLNPNVKTKSSNISWIGAIPEHWSVQRGKNVLELLDKPVLESDDVITCFRDGEVTLRKNRREEGFTFSEKEIGYQGIDVGDLVVHGMDGFAGSIGISDSRGKASPVLIVLDSSQNKRYLMYYLRSMAYRDIFLALSTGIRVRSCDLRWNKLSTLPFLVPPAKEQEEIVNFIDAKLEQIDQLILTKQRKIEILQEYKRSLIYEYVTGKKEVI